MNCFCKTTASARLWLYLKRLYFMSSAIANCISPYASFYAVLSCLVTSQIEPNLFRLTLLYPMLLKLNVESVFGPLLFVIHVNDMVSSSFSKFILFADNVNIFASHTNLDTLVELINFELDKVSTWLNINKLSLKVKKTHFITFHNRQLKIEFVTQIRIDNNLIDQVWSTKFLDVIIKKI